MPSSIALIEETLHNEVLWAYYFSLAQEYDKVYIYCNEDCFDQLYDLHKEPKISWRTWKIESKFIDILDQYRAEIEPMNYVVFTTVLPKSFSYFISKPFTHSTVVLHDLNYIFAPKENFSIQWQKPIEGLKESAKISRFYLKNEETRNQEFVKKFSHLTVPTIELNDSINQLSDEQLNVKIVPFTVIAPDKHFDHLKEETKTIDLVIPGTITEKSRDYKFVLKALEYLEFNKKTRITLLGRAIGAYGVKIQQLFRGLNKANLEIRTFNQFIHQKEFDKIMVNADLLILPIQEIMGTYPVIEQNGFTCVSGNINDMIKYQKKSLIPGFYPVRKQNTLVLQYNDSEEFITLLKEAIN